MSSSAKPTTGSEKETVMVAGVASAETIAQVEQAITTDGTSVSVIPRRQKSQKERVSRAFPLIQPHVRQYTNSRSQHVLTIEHDEV